MVYHGPSRGCETCKRRRKKCDEVRPSCMRCVTANRTCGGYANDSGLLIRSHNNIEAGSLSPSTSIARKCSLPVRVPEPGTEVLPEDIRPKEVSDEQIEEFALRAFFHEYCIISSNRLLSRGYLGSLESFIHDLGMQSDVAKACKVVAFAHHGVKLRRPVLTKKADILYHHLLGALARAIQSSDSMDNGELLATAILLGLYEIIMANEDSPWNHHTHAKGVAAILQLEDMPANIFSVVHFARSNHPLVLQQMAGGSSMFLAPYLSKPNQNLDDLLLRFGLLWKKGGALPSTRQFRLEELRQLQDEATCLDRDLAQWQDAQVEEFRAKSIGHVHQASSTQMVEPGYWPGRVDTYFDLYVAAVWNTSRTARLLLIDLILGFSDLLNDHLDRHRERQHALQLIEDIIASIPYHLSENLPLFLRDVEHDNHPINPGRAVGGLLLMHPIYLATHSRIMPPPLREYMSECLSWIGTRMGIGQASIFSTVPDVTELYLADGCKIIWAGVLI